MVYVVSKSGKPLMPTKRYGKVRRLLKSGLAVPISNIPFVIRLKYNTDNYTQDLWAGIDIGRENIGMGVSKENGECVFLSELKTNNKSVKEKMDKRRQCRQARKHNQRIHKQRKALRDNVSIKNGDDNVFKNKKDCKSKTICYPKMGKGITCKVIKGAESQFSNRKKRCNLTPSARQLIQMHILMIKSVMKFLPITHIIIEINAFNFQNLENQDIDMWGYADVFFNEYKNYKQYIYELQNGKCLLCGCNHIDHYHHIVPISKGGSNSPINIAGLCYECHMGINGVHKNKKISNKLSLIKKGMKKNLIGLINYTMSYLINEIYDYCIKNDIIFNTIKGYETYKLREEYSLPKRHSIDGYVISISDRNITNIKPQNSVYIQQRFKKKSAANIQKQNFRGYYIIENDKYVLVARNRHKSMCQTSDSLEEYMNNYSVDHSKEECIEHLKSLIVKPAKRIYLAHKTGLWSEFHVGDVIKYKKADKNGIKQAIAVATGVEVLSNRVEYCNTKKGNMKFCKKLSSSCIPYISKVSI